MKIRGTRQPRVKPQLPLQPWWDANVGDGNVLWLGRLHVWYRPPADAGGEGHLFYWKGQPFEQLAHHFTCTLLQPGGRDRGRFVEWAEKGRGIVVSDEHRRECVARHFLAGPEDIEHLCDGCYEGFKILVNGRAVLPLSREAAERGA